MGYEEGNDEVKRGMVIEKWQKTAGGKIAEAMKEYTAVKESVLAEYDKENRECTN
ncbi:hypothetical protein I6N96_14300 [Enterococcus sp. BWM-S5]|uniref:Uncharacterized protein n=1 Tax=Enterococcus larvae TaxID=2794352 RepID=A0ABS4CMM7_9ENTE|nr:hypothetical protein [Enterococcus larvae]MBP1047453.1 hypothetical protein [Enterococcus larvae]